MALQWPKIGGKSAGPLPQVRMEPGVPCNDNFVHNARGAGKALCYGGDVTYCVLVAEFPGPPPKKAQPFQTSYSRER